MIRNTAFYSQQIAARYPDLPADEIHKLCLQLMRRIYGSGVRDKDVRITSSAHDLSLKIYKPYISSREHNVAVQVQFNRRWVSRRFRSKQKPS